MKHIFLISMLLLLTTGTVFSQAKPYNVVFDLTSGETGVHERVIRWIHGILKEHPDAKLEVVFYGKSLPMVQTAESTVLNDVKTLVTGKNVVFAVCEQAMKVHKVEKDQLIPGVRTVHDAIYELISKQAEGFGYIKVTN